RWLILAAAKGAKVLVAEALRRDGEMRIRLALGASRWDLARHVLTESLLASGLGAGVGIVIAWWAVQAVTVALPWMLTFQSLRPIGVDWRALAFTAAVAVLTGLGVGLAPIVHASRMGVVPAVRATTSGSRTHTKLRDGLVVGQLTVTFVLLAGAGLLPQGFFRPQQRAPGFRSAPLLTVGFELSAPLSTGTASSEAFLTELRRRSGPLPGVASAPVSETLPP